MSNKFNSDDDIFKGHKPEDELGVAIDEFAMDDEYDVKKAEDHIGQAHEEDFAFSHDHKYEEKEEYKHAEPEYKYEEKQDYKHEEPEHAYEEEKVNKKYVVAESSKDRFADKIKGNMIYILIALLIIVPGVFKLFQIFGSPTTAQTTKQQNIAFNEQPAATPPAAEALQPTEQTNPDNLQALEELWQREQEAALAAQKQTEQVPPEVTQNSPSAVVAQQPEMAPAIQPETVLVTQPESASTVAPEAAPVQPETAQSTMAPSSANVAGVIQLSPEEIFAMTSQNLSGATQTPTPVAIPAPMTEAEPAPAPAPKVVVVEEPSPIAIEGDRSAVQPTPVVGNESAATSANINTVNAQPQSEPAAAAADRASDKILEKYFEQETKVDEQLQEVLNRMQSLEKNLVAVEQVEQRVGNLETEVKAPETAAPENNEQFQQLQAQIAALTQTVQQLNQRVQEQKEAPAVPASAQAPNAGSMQNAQVPVTGIIVEAVIPGRAWIRNQQGVLMVIEVGDEIPGAGKVTRIDAQEGTVATATQVFKQ